MILVTPSPNTSLSLSLNLQTPRDLQTAILYPTTDIYPLFVILSSKPFIAS
jgi:hypothetical protein